jgi:hypothetical protein
MYFMAFLPGIGRPGRSGFTVESERPPPSRHPREEKI